MAGRRITRARRVAARVGAAAADVRVPLQRTRRAQRRLARLDERLAAAERPADAVGAAADFVRSALQEAPPGLAERTARQLVQELRARGLELMEQADRKEGRR